jgi:hypothetical protein
MGPGRTFENEYHKMFDGVSDATTNWYSDTFTDKQRLQAVDSSQQFGGSYAAQMRIQSGDLTANDQRILDEAAMIYQAKIDEDGNAAFVARSNYIQADNNTAGNTWDDRVKLVHAVRADAVESIAQLPQTTTASPGIDGAINIELGQFEMNTTAISTLTTAPSKLPGAELNIGDTGIATDFATELLGYEPTEDDILLNDYANTLGSIFTHNTRDKAKSLSTFISSLGGGGTFTESLQNLELVASEAEAMQGNEGLIFEERAMDMYNVLTTGGVVTQPTTIMAKRNISAGL